MLMDVSSVDLDIEGGSSTGLAAFSRKIKSLSSKYAKVLLVASLIILTLIQDFARCCPSMSLP